MLYFSEIWIIITNSHRSTIQRSSSWLVGWYKKACVLHSTALHLPPHRVDHDPKVTAEHDPAQVAHDQVELVRAHLEIGAVEGLGNVPDEDENVESFIVFKSKSCQNQTFLESVIESRGVEDDLRL